VPRRANLGFECNGLLAEGAHVTLRVQRLKVVATGLDAWRLRSELSVFGSRAF
jgi:hypothetical protein